MSKDSFARKQYGLHPRVSLSARGCTPVGFSCPGIVSRLPPALAVHCCTPAGFSARALLRNMRRHMYKRCFFTSYFVLFCRIRLQLAFHELKSSLGIFCAQAGCIK
jgi:hypothetical protein